MTDRCIESDKNTTAAFNSTSLTVSDTLELSSGENYTVHTQTRMKHASKPVIYVDDAHS